MMNKSVPQIELGWGEYMALARLLFVEQERQRRRLESASYTDFVNPEVEEQYIRRLQRIFQHMGRVEPRPVDTSSPAACDETLVSPPCFRWQIVTYRTDDSG
jgi:hypothetical protein